MTARRTHKPAPRQSSRRRREGLPKPTSDDGPVLRMSGPGDILDVVPHLFGFVPSESLVLIGLCGPRHRLGPTLRMDLAGSPTSVAVNEDSALAEEAVTVVTRRGSGRSVHGPLTQVIAVVYTDAGDLDPLSRLPRLDLLEQIRDRLGELGISVRDALVVRHRRWWSIDCDDPHCCPADGTPLDHDVPSAAELTMSMEMGTPLASRAELEATVAAHVPEGLAHEVMLLTAEFADLPVASRVNQALEVQDHALVTVTLGGELDPALMSMLIALAQETMTRDMLAMTLTKAQVKTALQLWQRLLVACPPPFDAQVGAIMAQLAWETGQGALGWCACERVFATDPEHSLTQLIAQGLTYGIAAPERTSPEKVLEEMTANGRFVR